MRLTLFSDYSLRMLMFTHAAGDRHTLASIALRPKDFRSILQPA